MATLGARPWYFAAPEKAVIEAVETAQDPLSRREQRAGRHRPGRGSAAGQGLPAGPPSAVGRHRATVEVKLNTEFFSGRPDRPGPDRPGGRALQAAAISPETFYD